MINRTTKLLWRRRYKRSRRQVEDIGEQAEDQLERHFIRRLNRLQDVQRFMAGWMGLMILLAGILVVQTRALSAYYQNPSPVPGGIYAEGIIGAFTNANPLYAVGNVDQSVSRLLFSSLMKFDNQGKLVGDMAQSMTIDATAKQYTLILKENLKWHDGRPLTADDVVFTYKLIQNPDAKSPLFSSWQGVKVEAKDARTVTFTLPNVLTSFPYSLTNGIVPKHMLESVPMAGLRSSSFNTAAPVGSGPFKWETVEVRGTGPDDREERIGLLPNPDYYAGAPKLQQFIIRTFRDETRLLKSFHNNEINAIVGLRGLPEGIEKENGVRVYSAPVTAAVMVFFKTTQEPLKDVKVRQALTRAVDTPSIIKNLGYPAIKVDSPFLRNQLSYDPKRAQLGKDIEQANKLLDEAGWKRDQDGVRSKDGKPLTFRLYAQNNPEFARVLESLQKAWREIGIEVKVDQPGEIDFKSIVTLQNYDALLYGISLGTDPDVFAYWHSSQASASSANQLNFSQYSSKVADQALEGGRTREDPALRVVKYNPFLDAWRNDAPALALYQPRFTYVVRGGLYNFEPRLVNSATDRYSNVNDWMIRLGKTNK